MIPIGNSFLVRLHMGASLRQAIYIYWYRLPVMLLRSCTSVHWHQTCQSPCKLLDMLPWWIYFLKEMTIPADRKVISMPDTVNLVNWPWGLCTIVCINSDAKLSRYIYANISSKCLVELDYTLIIIEESFTFYSHVIDRNGWDSHVPVYI